MTFLSFLQLLESKFHRKKKNNTFLKKFRFFLIEKYFLLINFSNNK